MTIKYIRIASDLHLDFDADAFAELPNYHPVRLARKSEIDFLWTLPDMAEDRETLLLLPGDLWQDNRAFERRYGGHDSWIEMVSRRFAAVVVLLGNHDYWHLALNSAVEKAKASVQALGLSNVFVLEREAVVIDDVKLLGGTLWTDFHNGNPLVELAAPDILKNDFKYIRVKSSQVYRKLWSRDLQAMHQKTKNFIFKNAKRDYPEQHVVVLSHHAPSFQSIDEAFHSASSYPQNYMYFSDLDYYFCDDEFEADLWVHGHTHTHKDYVIDRTRIVCNPRGYFGTAEHYRELTTGELVYNTGFDPFLRLKIADLRIPRPPENDLPKAVPILEDE